MPYKTGENPEVLLEVVGQVDAGNCMRWKVVVPETSNGVTEIIIHNYQVKAVVITSKTAVATYGQDLETGTKWVSVQKNYDEWTSF